MEHVIPHQETGDAEQELEELEELEESDEEAEVVLIDEEVDAVELNDSEPLVAWEAVGVMVGLKVEGAISGAAPGGPMGGTMGSYRY